MSKIEGLILNSSFERVRDAIGQILADELANQKALANAAPDTPEVIALRNEIPDKVFKERFKPVSTNEYEVISVTASSSGLNNNQSVDFQNDEAIYTVIVICKAEALTEGIGENKTVINGDERATLKLHRLLRLCRSILMSEHYVRLGFDPTTDGTPFEPVVGRRTCTGLSISPPYSDTQNDSQNYVTGYFNVRVLLTECTETIDPRTLEALETTTMPDDINSYYWVAENDA